MQTKWLSCWYLVAFRQRFYPKSSQIVSFQLKIDSFSCELQSDKRQKRVDKKNQDSQKSTMNPNNVSQLAAQLRTFCDDASINSEELIISFRAALNSSDNSSSQSSLLKSVDWASLRSTTTALTRSGLPPRTFSPPNDGRPPLAANSGVNQGQSLANSARLPGLAHSPTQEFKPHPPQQPHDSYHSPGFKSHRSMRCVEALPDPTRSTLLQNGGSVNIHEQQLNGSSISPRPASPIDHNMTTFKIVDASELKHVRKRHAAQQREHEKAASSPRRGQPKHATTVPQSSSPTVPIPVFASRGSLLPIPITSNESVSLFTPEQLESFVSTDLGASTATTQPPSLSKTYDPSSDDSVNLVSGNPNDKQNTGALTPIVVPSTIASNLCVFPLLQGVGSTSSQNGLSATIKSSSTVVCTCDSTAHDTQPRRCSVCRASIVVKEAGGKLAFMERMKSLYSDPSLPSIGNRLSSASF